MSVKNYMVSSSFPNNVIRWNRTTEPLLPLSSACNQQCSSSYRVMYHRCTSGTVVKKLVCLHSSIYTGKKHGCLSTSLSIQMQINISLAKKYCHYYNLHFF